MAAPLFDGILNRVGKKAMAGLQIALSQEPPVPSYGVANYVMDRLILPGIFGFTKFGYRYRKRSWQPLAVSLQGKTAVVTGATSGLGRATAERLADLGAKVILVGRNAEKAQQTRHDLIVATGNKDIAVEIAELPQRIRGYGPIKQQAVERARARERELLHRMDRPVARANAA